MGPKIIQHDNLDKTPQGGSGDAAPWGRRPLALLDWRGMLVLCSFLTALIVIAALLYGRYILYWFQDNGWVPYLGIALVVLFLVKRFALVEQPGGYKVFFWQADGREVTRGMLVTQRTYAARTFPNAAQLTLTNTQPQRVDEVEGEIIEDSAPALIPDTEWLPWLTELPHTMIAGATKSGKTTLARVELFERLSQGYASVVLDPKGKEWYGLPVIGAGREFGSILTTLDAIHDEMAQRFKAYAEGERNFQPIKVLVDEVPDIMDACLDMRRRLVDGRWSRFARQLGSLAREIGISVTLMTQSPLVEDIGMNSAMRKNFSRVALGDEAPILLREERDPKRRASLQSLLRGQQFPAAFMRRGQVHLLDTSNVVVLSNRHIRQPLGWDGVVPQIAARPVVSASVRPSAVERATFTPADLLSQPAPDERTTDGQRTKIYLKAMAAAGKTRDYARERMTALNMPFENKLWTEVRRDLGLKD